MAKFSVENVWVEAPTKWQAMVEFESIFDRRIFNEEVVKEE